MKHLDETLDLNKRSCQETYFGVAYDDLTEGTDESRADQVLEEEEAMRTIQKQAKEINRYAVLNIEIEEDDLHNVENTGSKKMQKELKRTYNFIFKLLVENFNIFAGFIPTLIA